MFYLTQRNKEKSIIMDLMEYVLNLQEQYTKGIESQTKRLNELEIKLDKVIDIFIEYLLNEISKELDHNE